jgi:hypothetical protein
MIISEETAEPPFTLVESKKKKKAATVPKKTTYLPKDHNTRAKNP